jgi:hypothetical protein
MASASERFVGLWSLRSAAHYLVYPLELLGCTLPWSPLLLFFVHRDFRRPVGESRCHLVYLTVCLLFAFITCWLPAGSRTRYFSPLYPCLAVLIGLVIERCGRPEVPAQIGLAWRWLARLVAGIIILAAVGLIILRAIPAGASGHTALFAPWAGSLPEALAYGVVCSGLAPLILLRGQQAGDPFRVRTGVLALACFLVLTFAGPVTDMRVRRSEDTATAMDQLKAQLPPAQHLVSFGHINSLFSYYYGLPIETRPWPGAQASRGDDLAYFCFDACGGNLPTFPFAWEQVAVIPMDRNRRRPPEQVVVVGRCLAPASSQFGPPRTAE